MTTIYQSLVDYNPTGQADPVISGYESKDFIRNGFIIDFKDSSNGFDISLEQSRFLTLSRTSGQIKASYSFLESGELYEQRLTLLDQNKGIEFDCVENKKKWSRAMLVEGERVITTFGVLGDQDPDPYYHLWFKGTKNELPFDGRLYRWTDGLDSHERSEEVAEIMQHSKGILFEDLDKAKVCDMFQITQEELMGIPALLQQKFELKNKYI